MRDDAWVELLGAALWVLLALAQWLHKRRKERVAQEEAHPQEAPRARAERPRRPSRAPAAGGVEPAPAQPGPSRRAPATRAVDKHTALLAEVTRIVSQVGRRARTLGEEVAFERPNRRFADVLRRWLPERAAGLQTALATPPAPADLARIGAAAARLQVILAEIERLVAQRRDPAMLGPLGDADALAEACYRPIVEFARAEGIPLTTSQPVCQLGDFDLSIWTGFIPTSIAPIYLPADFFDRLAWWPAVAHELGHDFLASVRGLDAALRRELELAPEAIAARPLSDGAADLRPLLGVWFEELFCDVFGVQMLGVAYVETMQEHFGARRDAREVMVVHLDGSRANYGVHPPGHVRVLAGCAALDHAGLSGDARRLRTAWQERHGEEATSELLVPTLAGLAAVPVGPLLEELIALVDRLCDGPLAPLSGFGLGTVPGLALGPADHAAAERARDALLAGQVPAERDPRAVVAGAVLAWRVRPELEDELLALARAAIPAVGTAERALDAFATAEDRARVGGAARGNSEDPLRAEVVDALVLGELLAPPLARRGRPRLRGLR